jgi:hypothetical protein
MESVSQSVSQSVRQSVLALSPPGTHDQILAVFKTVAVLMSRVVLLDGRTGLSFNRSQSLSVLVIYVRLYFTRFLRVLSFLYQSS